MKRSILLWLTALALLFSACTGETGPPAEVAGIWQGDIDIQDSFNNVQFEETLRLDIRQTEGSLQGDVERQNKDFFNDFEDFGDFTGSVRGSTINITVQVEDSFDNTLLLTGIVSASGQVVNGSATYQNAFGNFRLEKE